MATIGGLSIRTILNTIETGIVVITQNTEAEKRTVKSIVRRFNEGIRKGIARPRTDGGRVP